MKYNVQSAKSLLLLTAFSILLISSIQAQTKVDSFIKYLNNKDMKYELRKIHYKNSDGHTIIKVPFASVKIKSVNVDSLFQSIDSASLVYSLVTHLNDPKRDWYCNLILRDFFQMEGWKYIGLDGRREWVKYYKQLDIIELNKLVKN